MEAARIRTSSDEPERDHQAECDRAWDDILEFGERLALTPARTQREILGKIRIFRVIAHEKEESPTVEEQLLASILDDIEQAIA